MNLSEIMNKKIPFYGSFLFFLLCTQETSEKDLEATEEDGEEEDEEEAEDDDETEGERRKGIGRRRKTRKRWG